MKYCMCLFTSLIRLHCRAEHAKPLLKQLLWLPIEHTIKYKIVCLCYQIISDTVPQYLADLVQIYVPSGSLCSSSDDRTCIPNFKRNRHGGRAFSFPAAQIWNYLHFCSLLAFKTSLTMYLFQKYFDTNSFSAAQILSSLSFALCHSFSSSPSD